MWYPRFKKDRNLIRRVFDRYRRRIAFRCNLDKNEVEEIDSAVIFEEVDRNTLASIRADDNLCKYLFDQTVSKTRGNGLCAVSPEIQSEKRHRELFLPMAGDENESRVIDRPPTLHTPFIDKMPCRPLYRRRISRSWCRDRAR